MSSASISSLLFHRDGKTKFLSLEQEMKGQASIILPSTTIYLFLFLSLLLRCQQQRLVRLISGTIVVPSKRMTKICLDLILFLVLN